MIEQQLFNICEHMNTTNRDVIYGRCFDDAVEEWKKRAREKTEMRKVDSKMKDQITNLRGIRV